jgi:alanine racemase
MHFVSAVTLIKEMEAGYSVSYNRRYTTVEKTKMALIPAGYADGFNRRMTNNGSVLIEGKLYPIRGTVCMDQFLVELGQDSDVKVGSEVTLFGGNLNRHTSITERSRILNTIPYEITCWISGRVPRVHKN